jgi:1-acyl-sn-glycerol-3-phosphate acyltransferase
MVYPQKNKFIHWFFHHYILWIVKSNFRQVNFNTVEVDKGRSVLLLANHFSWWDGFLIYYLNHYLFKKKFHVMVIEDTMQKVSFFKYMGAFSVAKKSREILASLDYAADLLDNPDNLVLIFPQGKLYSNFTDDVVFEKGLTRILAGAVGKFQPIMAATFIETLQYKKPSVNVYLKSTNDNLTLFNQIKDAYRQHYNSSKLVQQDIVI